VKANQDGKAKSSWYRNVVRLHRLQGLSFYGFLVHSDGMIELLTNVTRTTHMRTYTRNFILTAVSALAVLLLCPALQATTVVSDMTLTESGGRTYGPAYEVYGQAKIGVYVGPYTDMFSNYYGDNASFPAFCLDLNVNTTIGSSYPGTLYTVDSYAGVDTVATGATNMSLQQAEEVSFLASYALYLEAQDPANVHAVEGPIQMAIWQIMGTLGSTSADLGAETYVSTAQAAYLSNLITPDISHFSIWAPQHLGDTQRFVIAVEDEHMIRSAIPEPGTVIFLGTGVLLMALSRIRRRR
jgi:hypothetical protein